MKKKTWNIYAPIYNFVMKSDKKTYEEMYKRIPEVIKAKNVLEIATGPGLLAKNVAYAANKMIATDYSEGMIKEAKRGKCLDNLSFQVADATNLPFQNQSFDVVIIANALHIIPNPEKALLEIDRVLKKNGILIAPNFVNHKGGIGSRIWSKILQIAGISFEHQWSEVEYKSFLENNGWKVKNSKVLHARITLIYVECVRKRD